MEELISHKKGVEKSFLCEKSDLVNVEEKYSHFQISIQETKTTRRKATLILPSQRVEEIYRKLQLLLYRKMKRE